MSDEFSDILGDLQNMVKYLDKLEHEVSGVHHAVELPGAQLITDRASTSPSLSDRLIQSEKEAELNDDEIVDKLIRQILK